MGEETPQGSDPGIPQDVPAAPQGGDEIDESDDADDVAVPAQ